MKHHFSGLTLLELMICLAVISITLTLALPGLHDYRMNQQIKAATARLFSDLKLSRSEAISQNAWTIACPGTLISGCATDTEWHQGWLVFTDINGDRNWQEEEPLIRNTNRLEQITALGSVSRLQIRFFPTGAAAGSNSSIVFCDGRGLEKGLKIVISNSGRIRLSELGNSDESRCPPG